MSIKSIVLVGFIFIILSLANALYNLVSNKDPEHSRKTLRALTTRILMSILLIVGLIIAYANGLFEPTGIGARIEQVRAQSHDAPSP